LNRHLIIALFLSINLVLAQSTTKVHEFRGGNMNFDMTFYTSMVYGMGSRSMNTNSTLINYGPESIYWNPAGLAFMGKSGIFVDYAPPLSINPLSLIDIQSEINSQVDSEFKQKLANNAVYNYPSLNTTFPSGARIQSIGFAVPWKKFTFAAAYYNPFELQLNFLESGFRLFEKDNEDSATETQTAFRASGDINGYFYLFSESISFGAAYLIFDNLAAGFTFERYNFTAKSKATFDMHGSLALGNNGDFGEATVFNDPSRGYPNSLFSRLEGNFTGNGWGFRFGSSYQLNENMEFALTANIAPRIELRGDLEITENKPVFYSNGEIDITKIDSNKIVQTEQIYYHSTGMDIQLPGSIDFGFSYYFRGLTLITNIGFCFNDLSYHYSNTEKISNDSLSVTRSYKNGIKPNYDLRVGIDFGALKIGTGAIFAEEVSDDKAPSSLIIPVFSLSVGFNLTNNLRLDTNVLSVAMPFSRMSLSYSF